MINNLKIIILKIKTMKKSILTLALVAFLTSMSGFAQEEQPKQKKKKKEKTEKSCSTDEKKSCGTAEKKGGCCSKGGEEKK